MKNKSTIDNKVCLICKRRIADYFIGLMRVCLICKNELDTRHKHRKEDLRQTVA